MELHLPGTPAPYTGNYRLFGKAPERHSHYRGGDGSIGVVTSPDAYPACYCVAGDLFPPAPEGWTNAGWVFVTP